MFLFFVSFLLYIKVMDLVVLSKETLGFEDLKDMLGPNISKTCRFLVYDHIKGYKSMKELFKQGYHAAIILLEPKDSHTGVGHFILLLDYPDHIEHFDSYGLSVDQELKLTQEPHLTQFLNDDEKALVQSNKRFQKFGGHINTCGRWCVARLLLRHLQLNQFTHFVESANTANHFDSFVTTLTCLLIYKK